MPLRSVMTVDVDDSAFERFLAKFRQFEEAAKKTVFPGGGGRQPPSGGGGAPPTRSGGAAPQPGRQPPGPITPGRGPGPARPDIKRVTVEASKFSIVGKQISQEWDKVRIFTTAIARNMEQIGSRALHMVGDLTKITGMLGAVATGFGFLGMDILGRAASGWRRNALGLGTSIGGARAFGLDFSRFVDPNAVLGGVSEAMRDPRHSVALSALGITPQAGEDTADVAARALERAQQLAKETPQQNLGTLLTAYKLGDLGLSLPDLQRLRGMSREELHEQEGQFRRDKAGFNLTDDQAKGWQNFTTTLERARMGIETTFIVRLSPLAPALGHLSEAFNKVLGALLSKPELQTWIDKVATGLEHFATYLGTPEFQKNVEDFAAKVGRMAAAIGEFVTWAAGALSKLGITDAPPAAGAPGVDPKGHQVGDKPLIGSRLWENPDGTIVNPDTGAYYRRGEDGSYQPTGETARATHSAFQPGRAGEAPQATPAIYRPGETAPFRPLPASTGTGEAPGQTPAYFTALESRESLPGGILDGVYAAETGRGQSRSQVSSAGAQGPFQFMPATAQRFGLTNPFDLGQSADAASRYLGKLLETFHGNVEQALAGYNWGEGNVLKDIQQFGAAWKEHLPRETRSYVDRIAHLMSTARRAPGQPMTAQRAPRVDIHIHNETGGSAVMSAAQASA